MFLLATGLSGMAPAGAGEQAMLHVVFRYVAPEIEAGSFRASTREIWRVGNQFLRLEEAPDPKVGLHGLVIVDAPHSYMINRYESRGVHVFDTDPDPRVHFPLFPVEGPTRVQELEFGNEQEFFRTEGARAVARHAVDGELCDVFELKMDDSVMSLFVGVTSGRPVKISIRSPEMQYSIRYEIYERLPEPDWSLFRVPGNVTIMEAKS